MGGLSFQDVVVALVVVAALVFLVRKFRAPRAPKKKGPDVPLSRLTRKGRRDER